MTRVIVGIPNSGVTQDDQTARLDIFHGSDVQIVQHGSTVGVTNLWLEFLSDTIGGRQLAAIGQDTVPWSIASEVMVVSGYLWTSNDPTNTQGLPVLSEDSTAHRSFVRIGGYDGSGNTKIRVTDYLGTLVASSLSEVTHSTYTGYAVCFDWINYATVHVRIYMNTGAGWVQEAHVDSGKSVSRFFGAGSANAIWGENPTAGRGAKWRGVHMALSYSLTATDAPHLSDWPIYMSGGCVTPKAQGFYDEWSGVASTHAIGTGLRWQDVGDTNDRKSPATSHPGNDGDTSRVGSLTADQRQTFKNAVDAHPLAAIGSPTIDNVRQAATVRTGAGKVACNPILRLGGADVTLNTWPTGNTTYLGVESADLNRPGGGAWTVSDLDPSAGLEWGARVFSLAEASGAAIAANLTASPGPIPTYHTETLPTGDVGQTGQETPLSTTGGKGRLFRPQYDHITNWRSGLGPVRDVARTGRSIERGTRSEKCGRSGSVLVRR